MASVRLLAMLPEFELEDPDAVTWAGGQVRGPRNFPVTFAARPTLSLRFRAERRRRARR